MRAIPIVLVGIWPIAAAAESPVALQAEAGAASFVAGAQADRFGTGGGGSLRVELPLVRALSLQAGGSASGFANGPAPASEGVADPGVGTAFSAGGGLRLRPLPGLDRLWVDGDASYVSTGGLGRFGLDGGLGYDVFASSSLRAAPFARYTHVFQPSGGLDPSDARIAMVGIAVTWGRSNGQSAGFADEIEDSEDEEDERDADLEVRLRATDRCPDAPEDADGFEDSDGCSDDDNDHDGIADAADHCPLEPEVVNGVDDADGCPDEGLAQVVDDTIVLSERIFFETSKARIRGRSRPILEAVAALLQARADFTRIRIEGHADDRGNRRYNQVLSERRAEKVVQRLVSLGVDPTRLEFVGFGRSRPWQRGASPSARQANRRVEIRILETADGTPPNQAATTAVAVQERP